MDPSQDLIAVRDSLTEPEARFDASLLPEKFSYTGPLLEPSADSTFTDTPVLYAGKDYEALQIIRDQNGMIERKLENQGKYQLIKESRSVTNPFEGIGQSFMTDRAGVKLANCDAIYSLTMASNGIVNAYSNDIFSYADIAGGPGAWSQYVQYRQANSSGIGITILGTKVEYMIKKFFKDNQSFIEIKKGRISTTLRGDYIITGNEIKIYQDNKLTENIAGKIESIGRNKVKIVIEGNGIDESVNWADSFIDRSRMDFFTGEDGTGDLFKHWYEFIETTRYKFPMGVHLAMADGGYDPTNPRNQESEMSSLIMIEIYVALKSLMPLGSFILKIFDSVRQITADLIFILCNVFEEVSIFKPISSRPGNAERYVICKNFTGYNDQTREYHKYINYLDYYVKAYVEQYYQLPEDQRRLLRYSHLFNQELPSDFTNWLGKNNQISINRQTEVALNVKNYLESNGKVVPKHPEYDLDKALIVWNLPGNYNYKIDSTYEPLNCLDQYISVSDDNDNKEEKYIETEGCRKLQSNYEPER